MNQWRVTLLPGVLEGARHTAMLVTGEDKSAMLSQVLAGAYSPSVYPAQIVALDAATHWFLDEPAAADLPLA
jgi:6-phosphogluconolactonase/glucosamine-6-phosphate isomerase/deaminase